MLVRTLWWSVAPPSPRPVYLWGDADGQPEAGGLAGGAKLLSVRQPAFTTAAEMLARWCAKNELGDVRAMPYW